VLLVLFTWYELRLERKGSEPLFEFGLLQFRSFRYGMITGLIVNLGEIGLLFAASLYLQGTRGLSAFDTGVHLLPLAIMAFFGAPIAGSFSSKIGPKWIVTTGMVTEVIALLILNQAIAPDISTTTIALILGLYGLGLGLAIAQLTSLVLFDIPGPKAGIASGGNSTIRQVGAALGIAIIGTVITASTQNRLSSEFESTTTLAPQVLAMEDVFIEMAKQPVDFDFAAMLSEGPPPGMPSGTTAAAPAGGIAPDAPAESPGEGHPSGEMPPAAGEGAAMPDMQAQGAEVGRLVEIARSDAMKHAALAAAIFVGIGALSSVMLPNPRGDEQNEIVHA